MAFNFWSSDSTTTGPVSPNQAPEKKPEMPHELFNWSVFKCFDTCVGSFRDKNLLQTEKQCLGECIKNLAMNPAAFQDTQSFEGFVKRDKNIL
jgi:hypothetical protein